MDITFMAAAWLPTLKWGRLPFDASAPWRDALAHKNLPALVLLCFFFIPVQGVSFNPQLLIFIHDD
jgi:hypothetical protein